GFAESHCRRLRADRRAGAGVKYVGAADPECQFLRSRFVVEDCHEPQLKVKAENLAPIQQVAILRLLGAKSVHFGGQSACRRLTSQRGRRSELYLPESVYPFGQGRVTESEEVPID